MAPSEGFRARTWLSAFGEIRVRRRYNFCAPCGRGRMLAQERVGLGDGPFTPRPAESITKLAIPDPARGAPHAMAVDLTASLLGVEVSVHGAQRLVEQPSAFVERCTAAEARELDPWDATRLQRPIVRPADAVEQAPEVAYLELDGVIVMTRHEDAEPRVPRAPRARPPGARGGPGRRYDVQGRELRQPGARWSSEGFPSRSEPRARPSPQDGQRPFKASGRARGDARSRGKRPSGIRCGLHERDRLRR